MTIKRFRTGSGRLDANNLNKMVQSTQAVERLPAQGQHFRPRWYGPITCKITVITAGTSGQWIYTVAEVLFSTDEVSALVTGGFASDHVVNLAERDNTSTSHSGIDPADLAGTFDLQPIPVDAVVACYVSNNGNATNPNTVWFNRPGEFYGTCT
tara:strand:- start:763 stop:1224 length:462 start_codon:yes stop_codon:yes gene_type:complete